MLRQLPYDSCMRRHAIIGLVLVALSGGPSLRTSSKQTQRCGTKSGRIVSTVIRSASYGKPVAVNVYLPSCYAADGASLFPVIYLLHGGSADETQWPDLNVRVSADALIGQGNLPFVVIMPGAAYYESIDYSVFVIKELLPSIESQYRVQTVRSDRSIGGLSLGGYWAPKIATASSCLIFSVLVSQTNRDHMIIPCLSRQILHKQWRRISV